MTMPTDEEITRRLCEALGVPYASEDGKEIRCLTLDEAISHVESRSAIWRTLLERAQEVDSEWLTEMRLHRWLETGSEGELTTDVILKFTLRDPNTIELWAREGMPTKEFVAYLRDIADSYENGTAVRVG